MKFRNPMPFLFCLLMALSFTAVSCGSAMKDSKNNSGNQSTGTGSDNQNEDDDGGDNDGDGNSPDGAELNASALNFPASAGTIGSDREIITVSADINNDGDTDSGSFTVDIYLSPNNDNDLSDDDFLDSLTVTSLSAGATTTVGGDIVIPSSWTSGDRYPVVVVDADEDVSESNEGNNSVTGSATITNSSPDNTSMALSALSGLAAVDQYGAFNYTVDLDNGGSSIFVGAFAPKTLLVYLDLDSSGDYDAGEEVDSVSITGELKTSETYTYTQTVAVGAVTPGTYDLRAVYQNGTGQEADTVNGTVTVSTVAGTIDLEVMSVTPQNATQKLYDENAIDIQFRNNGTADVGPISFALKLDDSADGLSPEHTLDTKYLTPALTSGQTFTVTYQIDVETFFSLDPTTTSWYVVVEADNDDDVTESNESNNETVSATNYALESDLDWEITSYSISLVTGGVSESLNFSFITTQTTAQNLLLNGNPIFEVIASTDNVLDSGDVQLSAGGMPAGYYVDQGSTIATNGSAGVTGTLAPGTYTIFLKANSDTFGFRYKEDDEDNNVINAGQITVTL